MNDTGAWPQEKVPDPFSSPSVKSLPQRELPPIFVPFVFGTFFGGVSLFRPRAVWYTQQHTEGYADKCTGPP